MSNFLKKRLVSEGLKIKICKFCYSTENLTLDHKHPKYLGGTDDIKNIQVLCERCNRLKGKIPDGQLKGLWKWISRVDQERVMRGKRPRFAKKI